MEIKVGTGLSDKRIVRNIELADDITVKGLVADIIKYPASQELAIVDAIKSQLGDNTIYEVNGDIVNGSYLVVDVAEIDIEDEIEITVSTHQKGGYY